MSYSEKLNRAEAHLKTLNESVHRWIESNPQPVVLKPFQEQTLEYVLSLHFKTPFSPDWAVIAGDALFNLRATLDYIVYAMSAKAAERALSETEAIACQFPIRSQAKPFTKDIADRHLALVPARAVDIIAGLQPDRVTNDIGHPLWELCVLNNWDKHRSLHIVASAVQNLSVYGRGSVDVKSFSRPAPFLNDGDVVSLVKVADRDRKGKPNIGWTYDMMPCIKEAPGLPFPVNLGTANIFAFIRNEVIPPLLPYL